MIIIDDVDSEGQYRIVAVSGGDSAVTWLNEDQYSQVTALLKSIREEYETYVKAFQDNCTALR